MDIKELEIQLKDSESNNDYDNSIMILEKINGIIKQELEKEENNDNRRILEKGFKINKIRILETKLKTNISKSDELYIRGNLIKKLKEYKKIAMPSEINDIRYRIDKEVETHRELCKTIKVSKNKKIKISEKLGLTIKEISDTVHLFLSKHDIINKFKKVTSSTITGGGIALAIESIVSIILGSGVSVAGLIGSLPLVAYIGISSVVRNVINKTSYQNYQYKKSDEYKELVEKIPITYKEEYEEIKKLLKEKENAKPMDKIVINKKLIELYNNIKDTTKVDELAKIFKLEKHDLLIENKNIYEKTIDNYLNDRIVLSKKEHQTLVKENLKNDLLIFESENAIGEATKDAGKKTGIDLATLVVARSIASAVLPGYKISSISDLLSSLIYIVANNLIGIIKYNGKIKNTKYNNKKIKINNKEKFEQLANNNKQKVAVASI